MDGNVEFIDLPQPETGMPFDLAWTLPDFPDANRILELNAEFRFWHTESLLNQSANLIDQCLKDLFSYKQLQTLEFNVNQELSLIKKEIEIEKARLDGFKRDLILAQNEQSLQNARQPEDGNATKHARQSYDYTSNTLPTTEMKPHLRHLARVKDTIVWSERKVVDITQKWERAITSKKIEWFTKDAELDESFLQFKEDELIAKEKQLQDTEALDFSFQKGLCFRRLKRNYDDALRRAVVAEDGLKNIYGRPKDLAFRIKSPDQIQYNTTELYNWIYESIEYLTAYSQLDQSFTVCLSLRSLLPNDDFQHLTNQTEEFSTNFLVDKSYFPIGSHQNIRFKGIGASLIGKVGIIPWKIEVSLPKNAVYFRDGNSFEIVQDNVPSCILGRVENRNSVRGMEYGGMVSMNNLSPIAAEGNELPNRWSIVIEKPKSESEKFQNIEDVIIELNLTGKL